MLVHRAANITIIGCCLKPLYAFGASDATFPLQTATLHLLKGQRFVTVSLGNEQLSMPQGLPGGYITTLIAKRMVSPSILYFYTGYGTRGRQSPPLSTVRFRAAWTVRFLPARRPSCASVYPVCPCGKTIRDITTLGLSNFMMAITNSIVQVVCNATLSIYGGDLYVGVMTVINSIREISSMPVCPALQTAPSPLSALIYSAINMIG